MTVKVPTRITKVFTKYDRIPNSIVTCVERELGVDAEEDWLYNTLFGDSLYRVEYRCCEMEEGLEGVKLAHYRFWAITGGWDRVGE